MASYQFVYHMDGVSKTYPGGKKVFENIRLNFLPGVKIGVVGVNGAGKSTLLRIMAGIDKDFSGEAWAAKGATVGYLPQEPQLDPQLNVRGNVMEGVKAKTDKLNRYNELAMNYSDETAEEMARLQDEIDAENLWDLDSQVDVAMEALRCPPDDADVETLSGGERRRVALCKLLLEKRRAERSDKTERDSGLSKKDQRRAAALAARIEAELGVTASAAGPEAVAEAAVVAGMSL